MRGLVVSLLIGLAASTVQARVEFAQYEGPDAVRQGQGGTKISKYGIDFWTSGLPPRKFQVLGMITDTRMDRRASGHAIGSENLAKRALEAGGDALVIVDQSAADAGIAGSIVRFGSGPNAPTSFVGHQRLRVSSNFLVVKYLDQ